MSKRNALDALRAVYERGERCRGCEHKFVERETERLSGRATEVTAWRGCNVIESEGDPSDCPGVEDELARSEE